MNKNMKYVLAAATAAISFAAHAGNATLQGSDLSNKTVEGILVGARCPEANAEIQIKSSLGSVWLECQTNDTICNDVCFSGKSAKAVVQSYAGKTLTATIGKSAGSDGSYAHFLKSVVIATGTPASNSPAASPAVPATAAATAHKIKLCNVTEDFRNIPGPVYAQVLDGCTSKTRVMYQTIYGEFQKGTSLSNVKAILAKSTVHNGDREASEGMDALKSRAATAIYNGNPGSVEDAQKLGTCGCMAHYNQPKYWQ